MNRSIKSLALISASLLAISVSPAVSFAGAPGLPALDGPALNLTLAAAAQKETGAENFVGTMAKRALDFLGNAQQTQTQKTESFRRLLEDNFDMETIGRFTLGRYWKTATPQQQAEYQRLFKKRVVEMYSQRFGDYKGQKFETRGARPDGDNDSIVTSYIVPSDGTPEVLVEWRVRQQGGRYRVVDVIVEGVSQSVTQRSDFSAVIQKGGGDLQALLTHLKNG